MRYQEKIKLIQAGYFERFTNLKSLHPDKKGKEVWELLESEYDFTMYSTYDCFRTSLYLFNKKNRECKNQKSTSV
jgi:hypothetical protein